MTGATTDQITAAPHRAVYVWCNGHLDYPRRLALHLGRSDLEIVPPSWVRAPNLRAHRRPIVVDHATYLTARQVEELTERGPRGYLAL